MDNRRKITWHMVVVVAVGLVLLLAVGAAARILGLDGRLLAVAVPGIAAVGGLVAALAARGRKP